jgi:hypothetical protein
MTRRGGVGKGTGSIGCRGADHGQACAEKRTGAVAVRAALESAVQVGRGNEGNRQAEMANPTKCRDSLQWPCDAGLQSTSHDSLTGCMPGVWRCQCPECGYGDVLLIFIYWAPLLGSCSIGLYAQSQR